MGYSTKSFLPIRISRGNLIFSGNCVLLKGESVFLNFSAQFHKVYSINA